MKIIYGVHGYGRGHSSRALAVLPELADRHELIVLAGGDAYDALAADYNVIRIATLRYYLTKSGRRSGWRTIVRGMPNILDIRVRGPAFRTVCEILQEHRPDVVVSDSETQTHWAARYLSVPRISFDHFAVLVHCRWPMKWHQKLINHAEARLYRRFMAKRADRYVIASFYPAEPRHDGVCVVGPVLRETVRAAEPARGEFLLVYFANGRVHFTPRIREALQAADAPVIVYGAAEQGCDGNIEFRPPSNTQFVTDLAACRAVFSTAGNQLISEAMYLRKPLLLMPEDSLEQQLNATAVAEMGIGRQTTRRNVTTEVVNAFLADGDELAANFPAEMPDGRTQAVEAIDRYARQLAR